MIVTDKQTKRKLEEENKTNTFFVCLANLSDEKFKKIKQRAYFIVVL